MYEQAIKCQISPEAFWNYSIWEVQDLIQEYCIRQQEEAKMDIMKVFIQAEVIAGYLCREEGQDIPRPWDYYPELFKEERQKYQKAKEERELEEYKAARRSYVAEFNKRREIRGGGETYE